MTRPLHLAVALDGAGWHPTAWRLPTARPRDLLSAGYWVDLTRRSEEGLIDFVTFEDGLSLQSTSRTGPDHRTDEVRGIRGRHRCAVRRCQCSRVRAE